MSTKASKSTKEKKPKEKVTETKKSTTTKKETKKTKPRRKKNTVLTDLLTYTASERMKYEDPSPEEIKVGKATVTAYRVNIYTTNEDNTEGDLICDMEECFSFGVSENTDQSGKPNGYSLPLCLYDKDGATENQKLKVKKMEEIIQHAKEHIYNIRKEIKKDIDSPNDKDLRKLEFFYYSKDEDGNKLLDKGPTIYPKLMERKEKEVKDSKTGEVKVIPQEFFSKFYDVNNVDEKGDPVELNPLDLIQKYMKAKCAIKFESIFVGNAITFQYKVYECDCDILQSSGGSRKLLHKKNDKKVEKLVGKKEKAEKKVDKKQQETNDDELSIEE
jgi:hypothetical protein